MNPSKGARARVELRLPQDVLDRMLAYKAQHGLDGLPAVIVEWSSLRGDRDGELESARAELQATRSLYNAALMVNADQARELKVLRRRSAKRGIRGHAHPVALVKDLALARCPCSGRLDPPFSDASGLCVKCRSQRVAELQRVTNWLEASA